VIDIYVRTYRTAELDERVARVEKLSDAELVRIAMGERAAENVSPLTWLLTVGSR
jgi:hypothetical protein